MRCQLRKLRVFPLVLFTAILASAFAVPHVALTVPLRVYPNPNLRKYTFAACITDNGGVTPFKVGGVIYGTFTYDTMGADRLPEHKQCGHYVSPQNSLSFQSGEDIFSGTGTIMATMSVFAQAEHFGVVAHDLQLPKGWKIDKGKSQSFGVLFQNAPPKGVLLRKELPDRLALENWQNTRELRLDFFGISFPNGAIQKRATVFAKIDELREVPEDRR